MPARPAAFIIRVPVQVSATPLLVLIPSNVSGKAADDGLRFWAPATHVGDLHGVSGCWLWPGPELNVVVFWEMNQKAEDLWLSLQSALLFTL